MKKGLRHTAYMLFGLLILLVSTGVASSVVVTVPDTTVRTGSTFLLPVRVDDVTDLGIISYQFTLTFDSDVLEAGGVSKEGCLGGQWGDPTVNTTVPGEVTVVNYGIVPLAGSGPLVKVEFLVLGNPGETSPFTFSPFTFNEGDPQAQIADPAAIFAVTSTDVPILSVFPDTLDYGEVDTVKFLTVINAGVGTLEWHVVEIPDISWVTTISPSVGTDNDIVALTISRLKMNAGTYSGTIRIESNGGHQDILVTMTVLQEQLRVSVTIPDTSQYKSRKVELPVRVEDVTGMDIIAYEFTLQFDPSVINVVGASIDQSLSEQWGDPSVNTDTTGQITVTHFGTSPLLGYGSLVSIICIAVGNPGDSTELILGRFVFNNGYPFVDWNVPAAIFSVDTADVPLLFLSPTVLDFGSTENIKTFDILNLGIDTLRWTVLEDPDASWMTAVFPLSGVGEATVSVAVSRINLTAGLYSGKVSVPSNGGDGSITVSISVPSGPRRVHLSLPDTMATVGSEMTIPVRVDEVTAFGIIDFEFTLHFEEQVMEIVGALSAGTLSDEWGSAEGDLSKPGQASISHRGQIPLTGSGSLIGLRVKAVGSPEDTTELVFSEVLFNSSEAVAQFETPAGMFTVQRPDHPFLSVSPISLDFGLFDDSKNFTIKNIGTGTLQWSVFESPEVEWITSVFPTDGQDQGTVTVIVSRVGLLPEEYNGAVYVASNGGYENVAVRMAVAETDTLPPFLAFSSPQAGADSVARNAPVSIVIEDLDSDVNLSTVYVVVASDTVVSEGQDRTGGAVHFFQRRSGVALMYTPQTLFNQEAEVIVSLRAEDTALPSHLYEETFTYTTGSSVVEVTTQAILDSEGGTVTDASGVLVTVPPGVLDDSLAIFLGPVADPPSLPDTLTPVGTTYVFGPEGLVFCPLPGVGRLIYTESDLDSAGVTNPLELRAYNFATGTGSWETLEVFHRDLDERTVLFNLCRFGYATLGVTRTTSTAGEDWRVSSPVHFQLLPTWPNPFNSSIFIPFEISPVRSQVEVGVRVYNLLGEEVRSLFQGHLAQGRYGVRWDGRDGSGLYVPTGIYFCRMTVSDLHDLEVFQQTRKMLFLK